MNKYHAKLVVLLAVCSCLPGAFAGEWELVKDSGQLRVERRPYQGSGLAELRGVMVVKSTLNAVTRAACTPMLLILCRFWAQDPAPSTGDPRR